MDAQLYAWWDGPVQHTRWRCGECGKKFQGMTLAEECCKVGLDLKCDKCGKELTSYDEVAYDGPKDRGNDECHPAMAWEAVCKSCDATSPNQ